MTDDEGRRRPLVGEDILVVAPYNLAVRCIQDVVPDGVRVGTVDRFQGQEAPVVFYAMTCSSGDDVPRGLNFLFDQNRFNVAISTSAVPLGPRLQPAAARRGLPDARVDAAARWGLPLRRGSRRGLGGRWGLGHDHYRVIPCSR